MDSLDVDFIVIDFLRFRYIMYEIATVNKRKLYKKHVFCS